MKCLILLVIVASAVAEDYQFFNPRFQQLQQNGPYQPSGWRPAGARFSLPLRQQLPHLEYPPPPPPQEYGPPPREYGPPPSSTTTEAPETTTTTELPTTTDNIIESEQIKSSKVKESEKTRKKMLELVSRVFITSTIPQDYYNASSTLLEMTLKIWRILLS